MSSPRGVDRGREGLHLGGTETRSRPSPIRRTAHRNEGARKRGANHRPRVAVRSALASGEALSALAPLIVGGLLIAYSMWWVYFDRPVHDLLTGLGKAILWGYEHYAIFAAAAAVGAGMAVAVDQATGHAKTGAAGAGAAVAVPVAVYLLCLWFLHDRPEYGRSRLLGPIAAGLILLTPLTGRAVLLTGAILAGMIALKRALLRPRLGASAMPRSGRA